MDIKRFLSKAVGFIILLTMIFASPLSLVQATPTVQQQTPYVEPELLEEIAGRADNLSYMIYLREKADLSAAYGMDWAARGDYVYEQLTKTAKASQARVISYLQAQGVDYQAFWIDNIIIVESSSKHAFNGLMNFAEIGSLRARRHPILYEDQAHGVSDELRLAVETNLLHVNADDVWGMGYTGDGIVVANMDTGVLYTHEALVNQYRGNNGDGTFTHDYNWYDPYAGTTEPYDSHSHGSHTMGTMVGDDGAGNQIGMAPGAEWMNCMIFNPSATDAGILACGQFIAAPTKMDGTDALPSMRPNVVNNSWGDCGTTYDNWFEDVINAWQAAGIYPVFSNGNASNCLYPEPPGLNTVGNPARSGNVTGVGATGADDGAYATFSNWGPTDDPDTVNPNGYANLKPQVVAPGDYIRSAYNNSDTTYGLMSGTSMSSPHVAGLVALMWEAAPCLLGDYAITETILQDTATPIPYATNNGDEGPGNVPNHATGWGEINAEAAVNAAIGYCGDSSITGTVTDSATSNAIQGAYVEALATDPANDRHASSNASGDYLLNVYAGDSYDLTFSAYGYSDEVFTAVAVTNPGDVVVQNATLDPLTSVTLSGVVTDASGQGYPLYAKITITSGSYSEIIYTNPFDGSYSTTVFEGEIYDFTVTAMIPGYQVVSDSGNSFTAPIAVKDFALPANLAACAAPGYEADFSFFESFDTAALPAGWSVTDDAGNGGIWVFDDPGGRGNLTGGDGNFAIVDSDDAGFIDVDTSLITPSLNFTGITSAVLEFDQYYNNFSSDVADVDIRLNGGVWVNILNQTADAGPQDHQTLDISAYVANQANVQIRFHYYNANWDWYWMIDNVKVNGGACDPVLGAPVAGFVTDANTGLPLIGADVTGSIAGTLSVATPADAALDDGFYWYFQPTTTDPESVAVTASIKDYADDVETVTVNSGVINRQDFALGSGHLTLSPSSLSTTLELGQSDTLTLTITNDGSAAATYELLEIPGTFTAGRLNIPAVHNVDDEKIDAKPLVFTRAPALKFKPESTQTSTLDVSIFLGANAYGVDLINVALSQFDVDTPGTFTSTLPVDDLGFYGGDFINGDLTTLYAISDITSSLYTIDVATGVATLVGATAVQTGHTWTGLAGSNTGELYGSSTDGSASYLYEIDPSTGASSVIGAISGVAIAIDIAINTQGELFALDMDTASLYEVDPTSGAATLIGNTGFDFSYAQGMDFDDVSGILYWAAYGDGTSTFGELRVIDTDTGASASIGAFPGGAEIDAFAVATVGSMDVPWLSESPITGTIAAGASEVVQVTFDAAAVSQPGTYTARLRVRENTPYSVANYPVEMIVTAPSNYGYITGSWETLLLCDESLGVMGEGKTVEIRDASGTTLIATTPTSATGDYIYYLPGDASYDLTFSDAGYITQVFEDVYLPASGSVVQDVQMVLDEPCIRPVPDDFQITMNPDATADYTINLINNGAGNGTFTLAEVDYGLQSRDVMLSEGFEGGIIPPTDWTTVVTRPSYTWQIGDFAPNSGVHNAIVLYDESLATQDEWLISPELNLLSGTLTFYSYGNLTWCKDTYDNCDLDVYIIVGDVGGGDDIFVGTADDDWVSTWAYAQSTFDLTPLLPGGPVRIGFNYYGADGAEIGIDDIMLDGVPGGTDITWMFWNGGVDPSPSTIPVTLNGYESTSVTFTVNTAGLLDGEHYNGKLRLLLPGYPAEWINVDLFINLVEFLMYLPVVTN